MTINSILKQNQTKLVTFKDVIVASESITKMLCEKKYDTNDFEPLTWLHNKLDGHFITTYELQRVLNTFLIFLKITTISLPKTKQKLATIADLKYMYNIIKKKL